MASAHPPNGVVEEEGKAKAFGLVEALLFTTSKTAVIGVKSCPVMKHLYPCDNNWGARGNRHADRVAKPLCPKDNNGFRDGA
jgi:hypothetical protein